MIPRILLSLALLCIASTASAERYLLTVVTADAPSPKAVQLLDWFATDARLSKVWNGCDSQKFTTSNLLYLERYAHTLQPTDLPVVVLARQSGGVIYKSSGANIPSSAAGLFAALQQAHKTAPPEPVAGPAAEQCPNCPKRPVQPAPPPNSRPFDGRLVPRIVDAAIPDTVEVNPSINVDLPGWVIPTSVAILALLGLLFLGFLGLLLLGGGAFAFFR